MIRLIMFCFDPHLFIAVMDGRQCPLPSPGSLGAILVLFRLPFE